MSINFENPMNDETKRLAETMFKELVAIDETTILANAEHNFHSHVKKLADASNQVVRVELNNYGEIKELSDGTKYQVTESGWKKI